MALAKKNVDETEALIGRHENAEGGAGWAKDARLGALARLRSMGAPARRDEYWKFTNPARLVSDDPAQAQALQPEEPQIFQDVEQLKVTFVDGVYRADLSDPLELAGLEIETLEQALSKDIHWARDLFGVLEAKGQDPVDRPLAALNTATATQGLVIRATGKAAKPISIRYVHEGAGSDAVLHHVIRVEEGAGLTVLESGPVAARCNIAMEVDIADKAAFHHIRTQGRDHDRAVVTHSFARIGSESLFKSFTLTVNGSLTRNECVIEMTGDESSAHIGGVASGSDDFVHDDTVFITHDAVNCESRQVFKKVLRDGATGIFQGKILVKADAQKTDGYQISQGLLLDDDSQFLAKPELEIYADDVACSHGSTCGGVDETSLFYLTSRGISKQDAQDMLVLAFADEAIAEIADETLADEIRDCLGRWISRASAG